MTFTFNSLLSWFLHVINSAIPVIIGIVVAGRINKFIDFCDNHCSDFDNWDGEDKND